MPEEKKTSSGIKPEETQLLKPTVMQSPSASKRSPTIIASEAQPVEVTVKPHRPTVIDAKDEPSEGEVSSVRPVPTTIRPETSSSMSFPNAPIVKQASVMPGGVEVKPLSVDYPILSSRFPGTSRETLEESMKIISRVVLETLTESECAQWGIELQQRYGKLADESLKFATSKQVQDSGRHLSRLYLLLDQLAASFQAKASFWSKPETPWEVLRRIDPEVQQLRNELDANLQGVLTAKGKLEALSNESEKLMTMLDAYNLAALYLADLVKNQHSTRSLNDRSLSLLRTMANVQEGMVLRQVTIDEIGSLAAKIQDAVLITLPAWLECAGMLAGKTCTETEMYKAREGLREIIDVLK